MIEVRNLWKTYYVKGVGKTVAKDLNLTFPTGKSVGLFGRNGAGKSTLLRMIAGVEDPDSGSIRSDGTISWPVGFAGSFHADLTGAQNTRFVARVYGVDTDELVAYVQDFAKLGVHFHAPFRTYSSGMRSRLAFGVSMGIKFDTYLVDEVTSVGDAAFRKRSTTLLQQRVGESAAIVVSHSMNLMEEICDAGVVLVGGRASWFDDVKDAIEFHESTMNAQ
ncbi:capsular polysaccharide transport system ATP-binding protein [Aliiroseovarius sediminilitoris]|uniref:Capsular polysaccharide transport system ATP-binding protein n=1 Tax=Aliiroseovarius sediminilitoris TaxID=1173584 RepID=A0A1I0MKI4_9RHOB|nr:ABC transporter ATP-binding protein [Aliiroseovarius sediminilitoris]SEV88912.1 capsular polysaccharide transport system ATP-binding protein [Aliiroseovarius sediminilitoris]